MKQFLTALVYALALIGFAAIVAAVVPAAVTTI